MAWRCGERGLAAAESAYEPEATPPARGPLSLAVHNSVAIIRRLLAA